MSLAKCGTGKFGTVWARSSSSSPSDTAGFVAPQTRPRRCPAGPGSLSRECHNSCKTRREPPRTPANNPEQEFPGQTVQRKTVMYTREQSRTALFHSAYQRKRRPYQTNQTPSVTRLSQPSRKCPERPAARPAARASRPATSQRRPHDLPTRRRQARAHHQAASW